MQTDTVPSPANEDPAEVTIPFDLYREVHKGLRFALYELTTRVGKADGREPAARADVIERTRAVIRLLHAHHGHEDRYIQPLIALHAPRLAALVDEGHLETEQDLVEIELLLERLGSCADGEGVAVALDLYRYLALFTARYVAHMALEEGGVMDALRQAMSFEELFAVEIEIRSTVPPPLMVEFMAVMLPAMTAAERIAMLGGMQAGAPPEIFAIFRAAAESTLPADDFAVVATSIGLA